MRIPPKLQGKYCPAKARAIYASPAVHAKHFGQPDAACGYMPPEPSRTWFMDGQHGWWVYDEPKDVNCRRCLAILQEQS